MLLVAGDFNLRSSSRWSDDTDTIGGTRLESMTSYYGLYQIINEPTHILPSSASFIDLILTNQPNLVRNSGVHPSFHQNCHHQIIFAQINLKVYYPPPYKRLVWGYKKANIDAINLAIKSFNWENTFNRINSQVELFNETHRNIFSNFTPNKIKTFKDIDHPWMNDDIKSKIKLKHKFYHRYLKHKRNNEDFAKLEHLRNETDNLISKSKKEYYQYINRKLNHPSTGSKTYWSIMKTFFNGKKVPVIPPLLFNCVFVTDFQEKANIFQSCFAKQCTLVSNNSVLPSKFTDRGAHPINNFQ